MPYKYNIVLELAKFETPFRTITIGITPPGRCFYCITAQDTRLQAGKTAEKHLYQRFTIAMLLLLLFFIQTAVIAVARNQFCMPSLLDDLSVIQHQYIVKIKQ